eukprot:jgi/Chrzof1/9606/Cz04g09140.t1
MATLSPTAESACQFMTQVADAKPLVQCITNFVSMDIMANVLLASGCSPAMAHSLDEVEEFLGIASALLINMGTLSSDWVASSKLAATRAVALGKPWVLDPVGCGATTYRTAACVAMLKLKPTVVRGNASEIMSLAGAAGTTRGVDSTADSHEALDAAMRIARQYGCVVAVSGARDLVTDGNRIIAVDNGTPMLTRITATGCAVTAMVAAYVAVAQSEPLLATAHALAVFGLAGESASHAGPGSARVGLLDNLHQLTSGKRQTLARTSIKVKELQHDEVLRNQ